MSLSMYVMADILHIMKIVLLCELLFKFKKREEKNSKLIDFLIIVIMASLSVVIYLWNNDNVETIIYVVAISAMLYWRYSEKFMSMFIFTMWITVILSMLDLMSMILLDIVYDLLKVSSGNLQRVGIATLSLAIVATFCKVFDKKYKEGIKSIGKVSLISFTLLAIVDTFIVMVMARITVRENESFFRVLYSAAFILVILGIFLQLGAVIILFMQSNVYKEKKQITEKYLNEQINHYEYLEQREVETKRFRHDLRNHMQMLSNLAHSGQYNKVDDYLEAMNVNIESFGNVITVQNGIADAIINQYYARAMQDDIKMDIKGMFPRECAVDPYDLCTILSNVLSNALEATAKADEKKISLDCRYNDNNIILVVKNTYKDVGQFENGKFKTSKEDIDYHGYGLINIRESVEKYNGVLDIETINGEFILKVSLNYTEKRKDEDSNR